MRIIDDTTLKELERIGYPKDETKPSLQDISNWFNSTLGLIIDVDYLDFFDTWTYTVFNKNTNEYLCVIENDKWFQGSTYEETLEFAIRQLIRFAQNNKDANDNDIR